MAGGAGSYGSGMPYEPGGAMGVLIHVACVMLGAHPDPAIFSQTRVFSDDQLLAFNFLFNFPGY